MKVRSIFSGILSFIIAVALVIITLFSILYCTVLNTSYVKNTFKRSDYAVSLIDELKPKFYSLSNASGVSKEFMDSLFTAEAVENDVMKFVDGLYAGTKYDVKTITQEKVYDSLLQYANEQGAYLNDETKGSLKYMSQTVADIYDDRINEFYYDFFSKYANLAKKIIRFSVIGLAVTVIVIMLVIYAMYHYKHKAFRIYTYGFLAAFIVTILIPILVWTSGIVWKIAVTTKSLYDFLTLFMNDLTMIVFYSSLLLFLLSGILYFIYAKLRIEAKHRTRHRHHHKHREHAVDKT